MWLGGSSQKLANTLSPGKTATLPLRAIKTEGYPLPSVLWSPSHPYPLAKCKLCYVRKRKLFPTRGSYLTNMIQLFILISRNISMQEPMSRSMQLLYIPVTEFIDRLIFRSNFYGMKLPWECHDQSQETDWRHGVTGPELPFFHKRKGILKIDQSVKMPRHKLSKGVACSHSSAPSFVRFLSARAQTPGFSRCYWVLSYSKSVPV